MESQTENTNRTGMQRFWWLLGGIMIFVIVAAAVERKKEMVVHATVVKVEPLEGGNFLIDSADIIKIINRSLGGSLDEQAAGGVDVDRIERILEEDPFVLNAEVALTANSRIKIYVEQREPIMRVFDEVGAQYYIDKDGFRVPLSKHFTSRTLVVNGKVPPHTPDFLKKRRHGMKDLYQLAQFIAADDLWKAMFEQIYVNNRSEYVLIPKVGDQAVILGNIEGLEDKMKKLKIFYLEGMSREGWQKYRTIDLRFASQVVCER